MRAIFAVALGLALQRVVRAEEPVTLAWRATEGDRFSVRIASERHSEVKTGKEPVATELKVTITGELRVVKVADDGSRECEFTFATLEGTVKAVTTVEGAQKPFDVTTPITEKPTDVAGKTVKATLTVKGQIVWDTVALLAVTAGVDLSDDLSHLFPALPKDPVAPGGKWTSVVDRHTDAYELSRVESRDGKQLASFAGTSKVDEHTGAGSLTSSLKVDGQFAGEWDTTAGCLKSFEVAWKEEGKLVARTSAIETKVEVKRKVEVTRLEK